MSDLVFWQNIVSPHQAALLSSVAGRWRKHHGGGTFLLCEQRMSPSRRRQGWDAPDIDGVEIYCLDEGHTFEAFTARFFGRGATHVCSGFHAIPLAWRALRAATQRGERTFVMLEYPQSSAHTYWLKAARYRIHALRFGCSLQALLCYGEIGAAYYRGVGFPRSRVHPIGYTVPVGPRPSASERRNNAVQLLLVGNQLHLKGLDLLLEALGCSRLRDGMIGDWRLTIVSGDDVNGYQRLATALGLSARIDWRQAMPNAEVRGLMAVSDTLVLPSRYDGWGAVVNEALHAGARVVVSDRCGASSVVRDGLLGAVFPSQDVSELRQQLVETVARGPLRTHEREGIAAWAEEAISPEAMARYVMGILTAPDAAHPPPWT